MYVIPVIGRSVKATVSSTSVQFGLTMTATGFYAFCASSNCWILQGANPTATTSDSMFVPANTPMLLDGSSGAKLAVIRDAADGVSCLTPVVIR